MKNCRKIVAAFFLIFVVCLLLGINIYGSKMIDENEVEDRVVVAFSMAEGDNPWTTNLIDELTQAAEAMEMDLIYHEPEEVTAEWQKQDVQILLQEEINYLVILPRNDTILPDVLTQAKEMNVPVILISRDTRPNDDYATVIAVDFEREGRICAHILADEFKGEECNIIEILGPEDSSVASDRQKGFHEEIEKINNINIIASEYGNFDRLTAEYAMEEIISTFEKGSFQAVFACSDEDGLGVLQALKIADYDPETDIKIVSINGTQDVLKGIVAKEYLATVECSRRLGNVIFDCIGRLERGYAPGEIVVMPYLIYDSSNAEEYLASLY